MKRRVVICENGHSIYPYTDELEDILEMTSCPICGGEIESVTPPTIEVGCPLCNWSDRANLNDAICWIHEGCPNCQKIEEEHSKVHLVGSSGHTLSSIKAYRTVTEKDISGLTKGTRPDYWEILIHFCNIDELVSILDKRKILAHNTGYFKLPAVCLTETPLDFANNLRKVHGNYGVAFKKSTIIRNGGMPAIYIIPPLMEAQKKNGGFCDQIKPFINILRLNDKPTSKKYDFLHEREWRIDKDIEFDKISPIGIVMPEALNALSVKTNYIEKLQEYLYEFGEIRMTR